MFKGYLTHFPTTTATFDKFSDAVFWAKNAGFDATVIEVATQETLLTKESIGGLRYTAKGTEYVGK